MSEFFMPYEGSKPYLFVSYSHKDSSKVLDTIRFLDEENYRVWYDEGIPAGTDWPRNIAFHMSACGMVLFFLSRNSLNSPNCFNEIKAGCEQGKRILLLRLDNAVPDEAWTDILEQAVEIPGADSAQKRAGHILGSPALTRDYMGSEAEKKRQQQRSGRSIGWIVGVILTGLLLAAALCGLYALATGQFPIMREEETTTRFREPETESETERETEPETRAETQTEPDWEKLREYFKKSVVFPDTIQEDAIRNALGKKRDDEIMFQELKDIKSLFFCGSTWQTDLSRVEFNENGELTVNGAPAAKGPVSDLSLIGNLLNLEELALMGQPVEDLSDLKGLPLLKELNLSGSDVSDLSGLQDLPGLETIHLEHSKVQDLMPLAHVPRLKKVTVSADMLPLQLDPDAKYDVVLVK